MKTKRNRRRGSALIMVLGILSVLLLMAVAFSSFVRTERSGSTNLKNAVVARSSLYTAVGRVMDAIDLSFDSPDDDSPVAVWPHPWLASDGSVTNDYFQSSALGINETAGAHVLMSEMVPYLTPAQLALARSARCNWAPILGSVNASRARTSANGGLQGLAGRPTKDDLLGRYAFIVLDTTGLGSINMTGGGSMNDRKATTGGDTLSLCFPAITTNVFVKNPGAIVGNRMFASLAQARAKAPGAFLDENKSEDRKKFPKEEGELFPADLFAGFAPSLDGLDPEGNPKIYLPTATEFNSYSGGEIKNLLSRSFCAMVGVFARSRIAAGNGASDFDKDRITMFEGCNAAKYDLSRSALAAVALMDGLDKDHSPGVCSSPSVKYWGGLPNPGKSTVDGTAISEPAPSSDNPLNYPCTESAPLLDTVYAKIEWEDDTNPDNFPTPASWGDTITFNGKITVGARGHFMNKTPGTSQHSSVITMKWGVLEGFPKTGTTTGGGDTSIRDDDLEMSDDSGGREGGGNGISWEDFFFVGEEEAQSEIDCDDSQDGDRGFDVEDSRPFSVVCGVYGDEDDETTWKFYPPTAAEYRQLENDENGGDVSIPVRVMVSIKDKASNKPQQQVPAPALEDAKPGEWWVCVNPCVWHGESSSFGGKDDRDSPAWGWAFCAVPAFACDTTSLIEYNHNAGVNFWLGDMSCRSTVDPDDPRGGGILDAELPEIAEEFWEDGDANGKIEEAIFNTAGGRGGDIGNWLQFLWLIAPGSGEYKPHVADWMDHTGHRPDMLHAAQKNGQAFVRDTLDGHVQLMSLQEELFSRFPVQGYASVGELGTVMCGPLETLSVFKTWREGSDTPDFHPVIDYFTTSQDRYPARADYKTATNSGSGEVEWEKLSGKGTTADPYKDLYSAAHDGRVNLNAPPYVKCTKVTGDGANKIGIRGDASSTRNPFPIATVLSGAPYTTIYQGKLYTNQIDKQLASGAESYALLLATDLCLAIKDASADVDELWSESHRWSTNRVVERAVVRNLSFLGRGTKTDNPFLRDFLDYAEFVELKPTQCDHDRESLLAGIVDGFTTRGQTYLAIIRADAYSPKFGENASVEDGTTLATTHAIVEFFRDPLPARAPDGSLPADKSVQDGGEPVVYHNWYIRSFRVF